MNARAAYPPLPGVASRGRAPDPECVSVEDFVGGVQEKELARHAAKLKEIEGMRARLKSGFKKNGKSREDQLSRLFDLRNEYVEVVSGGRYMDAASAEWKRLPLDWRVLLVMKAGMGSDHQSLESLAQRNWLEIPPPERDELRLQVRIAKTCFMKMFALIARV